MIVLLEDHLKDLIVVVVLQYSFNVPYLEQQLHQFPFLLEVNPLSQLTLDLRRHLLVVVPQVQVFLHFESRWDLFEFQLFTVHFKSHKLSGRVVNLFREFHVKYLVSQCLVHLEVVCLHKWDRVVRLVHFGRWKSIHTWFKRCLFIIILLICLLLFFLFLFLRLIF